MRQTTHASKDQSASKLSGKVASLLDRLHVIVLGPGLGRDFLMQETAAKIIAEVRKREMPLVVDADGLWLVQNQPEVVHGYALAVLTPNVVEFRRLCDKMGVDPENVEGGKDKVCAKLARRFGGVTIIQKGKQDVISNGKETMICGIEGGLKRCGGQGDVLTGCLGTLLAWKRLYSEGVWKYSFSVICLIVGTIIR
jgi:ATP-dependent NAD(P)H-hydrate dehydratase